MQNFLLDILSFGAILSSVFVITSKNPVIAVIFLISVFVNVAGYLLVLGIGFIGISYIIVYCGAIAILFLFVIMLINIKLTDILETGSQYTKTLPLALIIGMFFMYEIYNILPFTIGNDSFSSYYLNLMTSLNELVLGGVNTQFNLDNFVYVATTPTNPNTSLFSFLQIESVGHSLYTYGGIWLLLSSIILLLSLIAPIIITKSSKNE